jgi:peptidoglycan hydrolase-like protein with peptidoglycan-binding domain
MFDEATLRAINHLATDRDIEPAALLAVTEIESDGVPTAMVKGSPEPLVRWEGHYFDQRLTGAERERARAEGLASPTAGGVKNPASQEKRWAMITRASKINRQAALESFSIGVGQVMTAHWKKLGFASVEDLIKLARNNVAGQVELMVRYIDKFGLADELQRLDFTAFARGYNGPAFKKNGYHLKMAAAYQRHTKTAPVSTATGMLRMGSEGAKVRELQTLLVRAGFAVKVDGDYGPSTRDAVKEFQKAQRIKADGVAGPETFRKLEAFKQTPDEALGVKGLTETQEAKEGAGIALTGGAIEVARQQVQDVADKVSWIPGLEWLSTILAIIVAILVIGGIVWIAWGWLKAKRTDEGDVVTPEPLIAGEPDGVLA